MNEPEEQHLVERPDKQPGSGRLRIVALVLLWLAIATSGALFLRPLDDEGLLGLPELSVHDRAPRSIKAPRDFAIADPTSTERLRIDAAKSVLPVYDHLTHRGIEAKNRMENAYAEMKRLALVPADRAVGEMQDRPQGRPDASNVDSVMRALDLYLDQAELDTLFRGGSGDDVRDAAIMVVRTIHEQRITEDRDFLRLRAPMGLTLRVLSHAGAIEHETIVTDLRGIQGLDQARATIDEIVSKNLAHLPLVSRRAIASIAKRLLRPNVVENSLETQARLDRARESVRPVFIPIKRGETVVVAGDEVDEREVMILAAMARALESESRYQIPIGAGLWLGIFVAIVYVTHRRREVRFLASHRDLTFVGSMIVAQLVLLWLSYHGAGWLSDGLPFMHVGVARLLSPVAVAPLVIGFLVDRAAASAVVPIVAFAFGMLMDQSLVLGAHALFASAIAASITSDRRIGASARIWVGGIAAGLVGACIVCAQALMESRFGVEVWPEAAASLGSGVVASCLARLIVAPADVLFGYTSPLRLREITNLNHPLLRDLLVQAPGTYHHSVVVAGLAEAGARALGLDRLLARAGGYYHDIGKLKNPRIFQENATIHEHGVAASWAQPATSEEDAAELEAEVRRHVADGIEIGARHRLGQPVLEIIAEHHGDSRMSSGEDATTLSQAPVKTRTGRYPGPRPHSKEAALVLLADAVEHTVSARLLIAPVDPEALGDTIDRVFDEAIMDRQLDACGLSLSDLPQVRDAFFFVLLDILSRRGRPRAASQRPVPAAGLPSLSTHASKERPN